MMSKDDFFLGDINHESLKYIDKKIGYNKKTGVSRFKRIYIYKRRNEYKTDAVGNLIETEPELTEDYKQYMKGKGTDL